MSTLKKLITVVVLASMLSATAMANGDKGESVTVPRGENIYWSVDDRERAFLVEHIKEKHI